MDRTGHPLVAQSTLNYGLTPLSGRLVSNLNMAALERILRDAILHFEPRILSRSLTVRALPSEASLTHHNVLAFEIAGELWGQPYPLELLIKTEMDLESGEVRIAEGR
jgi:type VI secretion system protein ImpF